MFYKLASLSVGRTRISRWLGQEIVVAGLPPLGHYTGKKD